MHFHHGVTGSTSQKSPYEPVQDRYHLHTCVNVKLYSRFWWETSTPDVSSESGCVGVTPRHPCSQHTGHLFPLLVSVPEMSYEFGDTIKCSDRQLAHPFKVWSAETPFPHSICSAVSRHPSTSKVTYRSRVETSWAQHNGPNKNENASFMSGMFSFDGRTLTRSLSARRALNRLVSIRYKKCCHFVRNVFHLHFCWNYSCSCGHLGDALQWWCH